MPYFITDKSPDCSGWATVKEDGEVIGCHTTKQDAIDQMVAVSIAEDMEPGGERALNDELEVGDYVFWDNAGNTMYGEIMSVSTFGAVKNPLGGDITATQDRPLATIQVYTNDNGTLTETNEFVVKAFAPLTKMDYQGQDESLDDDMVEIELERALPDNYRPALAQDVPEGRACGNCFFYDESRQNADGTKAWCEKWDEFVDGGYYCNAWQADDDMDEIDDDEDDLRAINQEPPAYMRASARRGLQYYEDGQGGDGLVERTIREARLMADGQVSDDKWIRIAAWIARHMDDLDAPDADPDSDGYPSAGVVAHLLWGSGPSKARARAAMAYAEGVAERIRAEERTADDLQNEKWRTIALNLNKDERQQMTTTVERRVNTVEFDVRNGEASSDGMSFTGYAAVFNSPSEPLPFTEVIREGAFKRSLKSRNEIKLFMNHNTDVVLGSTRAGTLKLTEDSRGLLAQAELPDTSAGRDLSVLMKRGDVSSMSFGFSVPPKGDSWSGDGATRELHQVRLHEVSIVTGFPAYEATTASVRSLDILAQRTAVDVDVLSDAILKLESGETLDAQHADLISEVVQKLRADKPSEADMLEIKRKQLDLMLKAF
jgi:HK97 family phage prohead protease